MDRTRVVCIMDRTSHMCGPRHGSETHGHDALTPRWVTNPLGFVKGNTWLSGRCTEVPQGRRADANGFRSFLVVDVNCEVLPARHADAIVSGSCVKTSCEDVRTRNV
jgi:hypothetical protein